MSKKLYSRTLYCVHVNTFLLATIFQLLNSFKAGGQTYQVVDSGIFAPQKILVRLFKNDAKNMKIVMFKTNLQVNTDGTPISYHPYDLSGSSKAINTIGNAVVVRKNGSNTNLFLDKNSYGEALKIFKQYRDSNYEVIPKGYTITWSNVLVPRYVNGFSKPCIIEDGEFKGYFGSATSLKNDLTTNRGECGCDNQVNPLKIPALVLVGGSKNILKDYNVQLGDLVLAYNPKNNVLVYAIINDFGPKHNLGEGSVLLNMLLLKKKEIPKNRKDSYKLICKDIIISIIPGSRNFQLLKPYTAENISERLSQWLADSDFNTENSFKAFLMKNN
jgi:hypothetical protein